LGEVKSRERKRAISEGFRLDPAGEVTSAAPRMTCSFEPSLRYCWTIVAIGGWGGALVIKRQSSWPSSNPMKNFMVVEALYPLCGAGTPRCPARVRKFFPPHDQANGNIAKRIESRSGDPNMQVISTHVKLVLIATSTSKA
jgi:hypothetical protein